MIPEHIIFGVWNGGNDTPPFLSIPGGKYSAIVFENRWEVNSFIEKVRFFQEEAFGKL